jgi:hypothetical protein
MATFKNTTIDDTGNLTLPAGSVAQRPGSTVGGQLRYNSTNGVVENYIPNAASWLKSATNSVIATGGDRIYDTIVNGTSYRVHLFTNTTTSTFVVQSPGEIEYLIIAGGGAGSKAHSTNTSGGGGGGGVVLGTTNVTTQSYSIVVGEGGTCSTASGNRTGTNGSNSSAFGLTAIGGGRGGDGANVSANGASGGSGGGAGSYSGSATRAHTGGSATQNSAGSPGFGNAGGSHSGTSGNGGCGGGGAGSPGQADGFAGGNGTVGGFGITSDITGIKVMYAAGGGSSPWQDNTPGKGGVGGGGDAGGNGIPAPFDGLDGAGGGGGGSKSNSTAGNGGDGVVAIRYPLKSVIDNSPDRIINKGLVFDIDFAKPTVYTGSGVTVNDSNLNSVTGIAVGSPTIILPRSHRTSMRFNGSSQHVGLGRSFCDNQELGTGNVSYTQEAWFKLRNTPPGVTTSGYSIFGNASATGIGMQAVLVGGNIRINFGARSTSNFDSSTNLSLNTWYHLVCTREAGVQNRIYINGQLDGTFSGSSLTINPSAGEMQIAWSDTRIANRLNGEIATARLYNTFFTDEEALSNFNATRWRFGV